MIKLTNILQEITFGVNFDNEFEKLVNKFGEFEENNITTHLTSELIGPKFQQLFNFLKTKDEYRIKINDRTAVFYIGRNNDIVLEIL